MGLLWMWAGLSCFLSSGDGYVGELLELHDSHDSVITHLESDILKCEVKGLRKHHYEQN